MTLSLRARLTLWYAVALVVALPLFSADVLWEEARQGVRRIDRELDETTGRVAGILRERGRLSGGMDAKAAAEQAQRSVTRNNDAVAILDAAGAPLAARWGDLRLPNSLSPASGAKRVWTADTPAGHWRVHLTQQAFGDSSLTVMVASAMVDVYRERHEVLEAMQVAIPLVLVLAGGGGFWLASVGLRPISEMAARAAQIPLTGEEDLGHTDRTDELGQFSRAFNGLIARLRSALQTQRQFMADASHELRTPVSIVRTASEVALSRDHRDEEDYRETLVIVGGEARRIGRLVDNMLMLARADAGGYPLRPVDVYLDEILSDCCRALDVLSRERSVTIRRGLWPEVPFRGDEELLGRLFLNVLTNAVQHTREGTLVSIELQPRLADVRVRVTDGGPGIPQAEHDRIFERFVQLDDARRTEGAGLGLPIARWIAHVHHGTIEIVDSGPTGSTFQITLAPLL